jgi:hypothetical protein
MNDSLIDIHGPSNYYGSLVVWKNDGKFYMGLEDYSGEFDEREVSESLFIELVKYGLEQYSRINSAQLGKLGEDYYKEEIESLQNILKELDRGE